MTLAPKDYLPTRKKEILEQIEQLKEELADVEAMESALRRRHFKGTEYRNQLPLEDELEAAPMSLVATRQRFEKPIKLMVLEALEQQPPMPALELLESINHRFCVQIERTSLSPQLTRLKVDGLITAADNKWSITEEGLRTLAQVRFAPKN